MKKLTLYTLSLVLFGSSCVKKEMIAGIEKKELQSRIQESGERLRPFLGTWMGIVNGDTLIVELRIDSTYNELFEKHISFIHGNYSYSGFSNQEEYGQDSLHQGITSGNVSFSDKSNSLSALLYDPVYKKNTILTLSPDSAYTVLSWKLRNRERFFLQKKWEGPTQFDLLLEKEYQNSLYSGKFKGSPVRLDSTSWYQKYEGDHSLNKRNISPIDPPKAVTDKRRENANREIERWGKFSVPKELILRKVN